MKDEITDEEIWSTIRYLDPDEKHKEDDNAETICGLAVALLPLMVWLLLYVRRL